MITGLDVNKTIPQPPRNVKGTLGEICSYCGGYGFTNSITGGSNGCQRCDQTGIEPVNVRQLEAKVDKLTELIEKLVNN